MDETEQKKEAVEDEKPKSTTTRKAVVKDLAYYEEKFEKAVESKRKADEKYEKCKAELEEFQSKSAVRFQNAFKEELEKLGMTGDMDEELARTAAIALVKAQRARDAAVQPQPKPAPAPSAAQAR